MKIGIDASRYQFPTPTGVEVYSNYLIDELQQIAHKEKSELLLLSPIKKDIIESTHISQKIIKGKRLWTLGKLSYAFWKRPKLLDTLFVPSHILPLFLPQRSIITIHDVAWKHFPKSYSTFQRKLLDFSTKFAVRRASKIIAVSYATQKDIMKFYNCPAEKIEVIHSGFDKEKFLSQIEFENFQEISGKFHVKKEKYFIYVGRIEEKKNIPYLIEAFLKSKLSSEWKLVLVGKPGVGFEKIQSQLTSEKSDRIIVTGYLPNNETYTLVKNARASLLVSKYEGFGFPLLEAFALEVPVIASRIPALEEVGADVPYFVSPTQMNTLTQAFKVFSLEKYEVEGMIEKGKERLKIFSWKKCAMETWSILTNKKE
ncbi:MAG: glycosyltransferase family 4 protein [Candidatus Gracilibacteria bacterium]